MHIMFLGKHTYLLFQLAKLPDYVYIALMLNGFAVLFARRFSKRHELMIIWYVYRVYEQFGGHVTKPKIYRGVHNLYEAFQL